MNNLVSLLQHRITASGLDHLIPSRDVLDGLPGPEPTPEFAAMVAEEYSRLLKMLDDETLRTVALRRLEGYTSEEIAGELGCAVRTIANKLKIIRLKWERAHGPGRNDQER